MHSILKPVIVAAAALCCGHTFSFSQNGGLNKKYQIGPWGVHFNAVIEFEGDIVVVGQHPTDSSGLNSVLVLRLDTLGNIQKLDLYKDPALTDLIVFPHWGHYRGVIHSSDGGLIVVGSMFFRNNLFVIRLNSNLELESFIEYESNFRARHVNDILLMFDHYYIFGWVTNQDDIGVLSVQKLTLDGALLWEKLYGHLQYHDNGGYAVAYSGGFTFVANHWYDLTHHLPNTSKWWNKFIQIDTSGSILLEWISEQNEEGGSPKDLVKYDSKYYYTTRPAYNPQGGTVWWGAQIVCRDSLFNLVWKKDLSEIFSHNWLGGMVLGDDGFLYATGQIWDQARYSRVYKIDPLQGDIVWEARDTGYWYPNWGSVTYMEGLTLLESGSVVAVGYTYHRPTGYDHGLVIKVTKDGCIDTLCTTSTIDAYLARHDGISVYPNPALDFLAFDTGEQTIPGRAELYDIHGRCVQTMPLLHGVNTMTLDKNMLTTGLYVWRVVTQQGAQIASGKVLID